MPVFFRVSRWVRKRAIFLLPLYMPLMLTLWHYFFFKFLAHIRLSTLFLFYFLATNIFGATIYIHIVCKSNLVSLIMMTSNQFAKLIIIYIHNNSREKSTWKWGGEAFLFKKRVNALTVTLMLSLQLWYKTKLCLISS